MNNDDNIKGIQIMPNEISIWLLMFADDVALLAQTVRDLQYQLDVLKLFCTNSCLNVNTSKTKVKKSNGLYRKVLDLR